MKAVTFMLVMLALVAHVAVAHAETPIAQTPPQQTESALVGFASGGAGYARLFGVPIIEGQLALGVGGRWTIRDYAAWQLGFHVVAEYDAGSSQYGLATHGVRLGPQFEATYAHRLHFGGGAEYALLIIQRRTSADTLDYGGLGVFATIGVDVVRFDSCAVFVSLRASGDALSDGAFRTELSLSSGLRF